MKQSLLLQIVNSCNDLMVSIDNHPVRNALSTQSPSGAPAVGGGGKPQAVARKCAANWSPRGQVEEWSVIEELLTL